MGDSLDSVEALLKKHVDFEQSLAAQEEKVKAVDEVASRLIQGEHYAAHDIDSRRKEVRENQYFVCMYVCLLHTSYIIHPPYIHHTSVC